VDVVRDRPAPVAPQPGPDRYEDLGDEWSDGMPAHTAGEGWIDDDGAVRAHVEWRDV